MTLILLPILMLVLIAGLHRVPEHTVLTVHRFGHFQRTLGPGWHWVMPGVEMTGPRICLIGHHLQVPLAGSNERADLFYQILDPEKAGETLESVDTWITDQTRDAMRNAYGSPEQLKKELNRRIERLGLRVIRCSLHTH